MAACLHSHVSGCLAGTSWNYLRFTAKGCKATHHHLVHRLKIRTGHTMIAETYGQNMQQLPTLYHSCISEIKQ